MGIGDWGLETGDWRLWIGDWGLELESHPTATLLAHLCIRGGWRASIFSLAPHRLRSERGPRSGEGGFAKGTLPSAAMKEAPHIFKGLLPHLPFTIHHFLAAPFHHYRGPPPPSSRGRQDFEKMATPPLRLLAHPRLGAMLLR